MTIARRTRVLLLTCLLAPGIGGCVSASQGQQAGVTLAEQGYFFVGGRYMQAKGGDIMTGQMFVQYQIPLERRHQYPIVMWHGGGQTGTNFLGTPDGRGGWAGYFLEQGYAVYVVDQPARARSGFFTDVYGTTRRPTTQSVSERFTAPETKRLYPQATLHSQWPGKGIPGDPAFDQFFASQVEDIADIGVIETLNREAGVALLDRIGPAILLTHSQSGPFGWALADARPRLVRAVLAIEPNGPPFYDNVTVGPPEWFENGPLARAWGISRVPLTYSPAAAQAGGSAAGAAGTGGRADPRALLAAVRAGASVAEPPARSDCDRRCRKRRTTHRTTTARQRICARLACSTTSCGSPTLASTATAT